MPKSLYIDPVAVRQPGYIHFTDIPVCQYNKTVKQELEEGNYTKEDLIRIYRATARRPPASARRICLTVTTSPSAPTVPTPRSSPRA